MTALLQYLQAHDVTIAAWIIVVGCPVAMVYTLRLWEIGSAARAEIARLDALEHVTAPQTLDWAVKPPVLSEADRHKRDEQERDVNGRVR